MLQLSLHQAAEIKPATLADASAISALHCGNFHRGWSEVEIKALLSGDCGVGYIVFTESLAAGFILARIVAPEAEIISLAVDSAFRRRGLAASLLVALEGELLSCRCDTVFLEVQETDYGARELYVRHGFELAGTRAGYYKRPDGHRINAVILRKALHA